MRIFLYIFLFFSGIGSALGNKITDHSAMTMSKVPLYKLPDLSCPDFTVLMAGTLVEVVGQSEAMTLDKDQEQLFYWYEVKTSQNTVGWVFGNNLALVTKDEELLEDAKVCHRSTVDFGGNFGMTTAWFATLMGRDTGEYISNVYREDYVIFTHISGRSVWQKIARQSNEGSTQMSQLALKDLTNDKCPELIVCSRVQGDNTEERSKIEVFQMQYSQLISIFIEDLTLRLPNGDLSPALSKCVDLEGSSIRLEYIDMPTCSIDAPSPAGMKQYCLEYVTYTYQWNVSKGSFEMLYAQSRMAPQVLASAASVRLYAAPDIKSSVVDVIGNEKTMKAIKLVSKYATSKNGDKKIEIFYYVQSANGVSGYVPSWNISFAGIRHENTLNAWNAAPPLLPDDWTYPLVVLQHVDNQ